MKSYLIHPYEISAANNHELACDMEALLELALRKPVLLHCDYKDKESEKYLRISTYVVPQIAEVRYIIQKIEFGSTTSIVDLGYTEALEELEYGGI